ncbi:MAG: DUF1667 domain-containing protein [Clostridia bacterium]|nr:DUF1667 domain-containing protein [Clostridia bacterium]
MAVETRDMTCIICPMGCSLHVAIDGSDITVTGNTCKRGEKYGIQEVTAPMRTVTTSVVCKGGDRPLVSVKTKEQVPKEKIAQVLEVCRKAEIAAPVRVGDVIIANAAGAGSDIVATCNADRI